MREVLQIKRVLACTLRNAVSGDVHGFQAVVDCRALAGFICQGGCGKGICRQAHPSILATSAGVLRSPSASHDYQDVKWMLPRFNWNADYS